MNRSADLLDHLRCKNNNVIWRARGREAAEYIEWLEDILLEEVAL